jgi:hypothetical protein
MTPNQIYKKDKITGISFKHWLQQEKDKGNFLIEDETSSLDKETYSNLTKGEPNTNNPAKDNVVTTTTLMKYNNIIGIVAISILIFGVYQIGKRTMVDSNE